jgi:hypothetical protein
MDVMVEVEARYRLDAPVRGLKRRSGLPSRQPGASSRLAALSAGGQGVQVRAGRADVTVQLLFAGVEVVRVAKDEAGDLPCSQRLRRAPAR